MIKCICYGSSSKGNTFLISNNNTKIVIDLGVKGIENKIDFSKIDGILIDHVHGDHSSQTRIIKNYYKGKFYGNKYTIDKLPIIDSQKEEIVIGEPFIIGTFKIVGFDIYHDIPNTGFLIKDLESNAKILFVIDTNDISNLKFVDLDYIFCECNYSYEWLEDKDSLDFKDNRLYSTHLPIEDTIEFLKENVNINTKKIILTHISSSFENYKEFEEKVQKEFSKVQVTAIDPHLKEPLEIVLKEDIDIDFD